MLRQQIYEQIKEAMKSREAERLETLRFIWSEIKNREIDAKHELSDEEVVKLLQTELKRRRESVEQFIKGGREDLATQENRKIKIIETFVPEMMGREEVEKIVAGVLAGGSSDFGAVMREVMVQTKGKADGSLVAAIVKERLS